MVTNIFIQSFFQIIDEKSLIKKYQKEISTLKEELDQLKKGMLVAVNPEELVTLRQKVFLQILLFIMLLHCTEAKAVVAYGIPNDGS